MSELKMDRRLMDAGGIQRALDRMAMQLVELNRGTDHLALVGIHRAGVPLANRIADRISKTTGATIPLGMVDITLYRDDVFIGLPQPVVGRTELDFDVTECTVVLVDDVLYTGRTVRAALDAVMDFGRPKNIRLAVLVDRGHRELPISADVVGSKVETSREETVEIELTELGAAVDGAVVMVKA